MTKQCQHLNTKNSEILLHILNKFEDMFDGTLGMWNNTPLYLELRDDVKPVCWRPYPVLKVRKAMFRK